MPTAVNQVKPESTVNLRVEKIKINPSGVLQINYNKPVLKIAIKMP